MTINDLYSAYQQPGPHSDDIREHLPTLTKYADQCEHVTEMGFRIGTSFCALLLAQPRKLITYDIELPAEPVQDLLNVAGDTQCVFHEASTLDVEIEPTDMLFIDTLHTYTQLKKELELHGNKSKKYLMFHDTVTFGKRGEDGKEPGLMDAIAEFCLINPHWHVAKHDLNNNGLLILERK